MNDIKRFLESAPEYQMLQLVMTDFGLTAFRIQIDSGIAEVKQCTHIDNELHASSVLKVYQFHSLNILRTLHAVN